MRSQVRYDRASVDRYLADVEVQSAGLQEQIEATRSRVQRAMVAAARRPDPQAEFGALFLAADRELERIEREHREMLDAIGVAAAGEAARLLAAAAEEAAVVRAASVATPPGVRGHVPGPQAAAGDPRAARLAGDRRDAW